MPSCTAYNAAVLPCNIATTYITAVCTVAGPAAGHAEADQAEAEAATTAASKQW